MTRTQIISLFFLALLLFVVYQILMIFSPFMKAIFWAAILAFGFYPLFVPLKRGLRNHDTFAAVTMTILVIALVAPPFVVLLVNLTGQAIELYQMVTTYIREGHVEKLIDQLRALSWIKGLEHHVFQWEPLKENATNWLINVSRNIANFSIAQAGVLTKNIFFLFMNIILVAFLLFIFLRDGEKIYNFIYQIAPLEEENKKTIFSQVNETFSAVIRGQLLTSLTQAILAGIIFWGLKLPAPIFFAAATFLATMIPVLGATAIWLPLAIYLFTQREYVKAGVLVLFGVLVISLIDNLIKPAIIGEKTKLPYFLLFFGILGGIRIYGIMGIFLGPVVLSVFFVLVKIYREKYLHP
jgi:predicted PurR-regulated permease PerM